MLPEARLCKGARVAARLLPGDIRYLTFFSQLLPSFPQPAMILQHRIIRPGLPIPLIPRPHRQVPQPRLPKPPLHTLLPAQTAPEN
jgi:hypothetical protein